MTRGTLLGIGAGLLVIGWLAGYIIGYGRGLDAGARGVGPGAVAAAPMPMGMPPGAQPAMPPGAGMPPAEPTPDLVQRIDVGKRLVAQDPKNRAAWIQLGNDYFDTHQRDKAVEAYARALELDPNDPNVLTDQGVMYRELGDFDKAIANFEKATKLDPMHVQSLYNLGVVQAFDKRDTAKATAAWRKVIEIAPTSQQATQARQALADLAKQQPR